MVWRCSHPSSKFVPSPDYVTARPWGRYSSDVSKRDGLTMVTVAGLKAGTGKRWHFGRRLCCPLTLSPFPAQPGILKRTDRLPEERARRRARRNAPPRPLDRVALAANREVRRIDGFWYKLRLAPIPDPGLPRGRRAVPDPVEALSSP
jgi:hypothetical protein